MILDSEAQRAVLLEMFKAVQIPGSAVKQAAALLHAIETATVAEPAKGEEG